MNVMGIIFSSDPSLDDLTDKRTMGSLPFGGRYRQIDFALSNLSHAGIHHVGIVSRQHYKSLMNHIGGGEEWGMSLEEGGLEFLTPYAMSSVGSYRGKLDSLHSVKDFLTFGQEDEYVIMMDASTIYNIDLDKVVNAHIASGKDITVVTKSGVANGSRQLDLALKLDEKGNVTDMAVDYVAPAGYVTSMDIFVLSKKWLIEQVDEHISRNLFHMDRDLVMGGWQKGNVSVNVYPFPGIVFFTESVDEYFRNNLALIDENVRHDIFGWNHPVFTKVRDRVPSYYGENCRIENCIVADGCMLEGTARHCVLYRQVTICEGAEVEDCVIMNDTVVGEGCQLKNVILDKNVTVRPGTKLIGTPKNPITVKRGEVV